MDEQRKYAITLPQQSWQRENSTNPIRHHEQSIATSWTQYRRQSRSFSRLMNAGRIRHIGEGWKSSRSRIKAYGYASHSDLLRCCR